MHIEIDDISRPEVIALLEFHTQNQQAISPPGTSYALDLGALREPEITVWTAWDNGQLFGCAALHELSPKWAELKSMRTAPKALGRGVGTALMKALLSAAKERGYEKLSLETGTNHHYDAAVHLYQKFGFKSGGSFADYIGGPDNQFFHLQLTND